MGRVGQVRAGTVNCERKEMRKIRYTAAKGAQFNDKQANLYGREIEAIQKRVGIIDPKIVLLEASDKDSPLHDYFEWDTKAAAKKHRVSQARHLINHIRIVVKISGEQKEKKAFYNVRVLCAETEKPMRIYVDLKTVSVTPEYRQQVIDAALREVGRWTEKYKEYQELVTIHKAVKRTRKKQKVA